MGEFLPIARAMAIACLTVSAWLAWAMTGLLLIYALMSWRTGDPAFKIAYLLGFAVGALVLGFLFRRLARRIEQPARR
ncbi:hypothetical protein [Phreatobacter sp.]|uniref:hypothetical protein n=1 Tax=Phreatobacter sp. TaxID=1966341 RepID=UPI003F72FD74